jgi:hypothetical protein
MKKAEKVEMKVMTTERSKFPPNITVQMLEAPPPGLHPTSQHHRIRLMSQINCLPVFRIRIRIQIPRFLGLLDPHPDP